MIGSAKVTSEDRKPPKATDLTSILEHVTTSDYLWSFDNDCMSDQCRLITDEQLQDMAFHNTAITLTPVNIDDGVDETEEDQHWKH